MYNRRATLQIITIGKQKPKREQSSTRRKMRSICRTKKWRRDADIIYYKAEYTFNGQILIAFLCTFLCKWLCHHFGWMLKITRRHKLLPRIEEHKSFSCLCTIVISLHNPYFGALLFLPKNSKTFYKSIMSLQKATWPLMRHDTYDKSKEGKMYFLIHLKRFKVSLLLLKGLEHRININN